MLTQQRRKLGDAARRTILFHLNCRALNQRRRDSQSQKNGSQKTSSQTTRTRSQKPDKLRHDLVKKQRKVGNAARRTILFHLNCCNASSRYKGDPQTNPQFLSEKTISKLGEQPRQEILSKRRAARQRRCPRENVKIFSKRTTAFKKASSERVVSNFVKKTMPYDLFACSFLREERGRRLRYREQRRAKSLRANYNRRLNELKKFVSAAKFIPATTSFEETLGKWHQLKQFQMSLMRSSNNHNEETIRNEEKNTPTRTPKVSLVKKNGNNPSTIEETNTSTRTPKESLVKNKGNSPSTIEDELDLYYRHGEEMEGHHRMGWMRSDASSSGLFEFMKFHENRFRDIIWRKLAAKVEKHPYCGDDPASAVHLYMHMKRNNEKMIDLKLRRRERICNFMRMSRKKPDTFVLIDAMERSRMRWS
mmetsp:Transcript_23347/g.56620  ORF Transcript_23347/g.56620 Transcript_23347/m.56620 type:complete len:420 (+) Transcript_23347:150-1409(+)